MTPSVNGRPSSPGDNAGSTPAGVTKIYVMATFSIVEKQGKTSSDIPATATDLQLIKVVGKSDQWRLTQWGTDGITRAMYFTQDEMKQLFDVYPIVKAAAEAAASFRP